MIGLAELSRAFAVSRNTIKNWILEYPEYFSAEANPAAAGTTRQFTNEDARVLSLIATMRREYRLKEEIAAALAAGDRGQWPPAWVPFAEAEEGEGEDIPAAGAMQLITHLTAKASQLEGQIMTVTEERDYLRGQLETTRAAALDAEIRAASAEAKLSVLAAAPRASFWDRFTNKKGTG